MEDASEFLSIDEAAKRLKLSHSKLRDAIERGSLPAYQYGERWQRLYWPEVIAWFRCFRVPVVTESSDPDEAAMIAKVRAELGR